MPRAVRGSEGAPSSCGTAGARIEPGGTNPRDTRDIGPGGTVTAEADAGDRAPGGIDDERISRGGAAATGTSGGGAADAALRRGGRGVSISLGLPMSAGGCEKGGGCELLGERVTVTGALGRGTGGRMISARRAVRRSTRRHRAGNAGRHLLVGHSGAETRIGLQIVVVLVERLVERRQNFGREHRIDLLVGRRRLGRNWRLRCRSRSLLQHRAILRTLQQPFDLRRQSRQRELACGGSSASESTAQTIVRSWQRAGTVRPCFGEWRSRAAAARRWGHTIHTDRRRRRIARGRFFSASTHQRVDLAQQRLNVDRPLQKSASLLPKRIVRTRERFPFVTEKQNVDPLCSGDLAQARRHIERTLGVDVEQDERRCLHRDSRHEERKRHIDDRVTSTPKRGRQPVGLG